MESSTPILVKRLFHFFSSREFDRETFLCKKSRIIMMFFTDFRKLIDKTFWSSLSMDVIH